MTLALEPRRTALVLIDLQRGIVSRSLAPHPRESILAKGGALAAAVHAAGGVVVLVHVGWARDFADGPPQLVDSPTPRPPGGLPPDFTAFAPEVEGLPVDVVVLKRHWGAFHGTELDLQLRRRGVDTIVLGGVATNLGVESTAREAWQHGYNVVLAEDATTSVEAEMHRFSIEKIMPRIARVRDTAAILAALAGN